MLLNTTGRGTDGGNRRRDGTAPGGRCLSAATPGKPFGRVTAAGDLRGRSGEGLPDSYHAERHPAGRLAPRLSGAASVPALGGRLPDRVARWLLPLVADHLGPATAYGAPQVSGRGLRCSAPRRAHPLTGRRAPDPRPAEMDRLDEALRGGLFVLVAPDETVRRAARGWADRVRIAEPAGPLRSTILVRPDGCAGWAAETPGSDDVRGALTRRRGPAW